MQWSPVRSFPRVSYALRHVVPQKRHLSTAREPFVLKDEQSVRELHEYVLAQPESRLPALRGLHIDIPKIEEHARVETAQRILDLLERAPKLESLTLPEPKWTFESLADKRIPEAISQISTLRELGLLEECDEMASIVTSTRSAASLRILRVSLATLPTSGGDYALTVAEVDAFLGHLIPTLEVLDIRAPTLKLDAKGVQYPALRSLMVPEIEGGTIRTDILVSKFPALDGTLNIGSVSGALPYDEPKQRRIRASNQDRQKRQCWKGLDRVLGDVPALFMLGLSESCPVRHLMVDSLCGHEKSRMADILQATPPTHLKLSAILYHGDDFFANLFPPATVPRLTHLALLLRYSNPAVDDEESDGDAVKNMQWGPLLVRFQLFIFTPECGTDDIMILVYILGKNNRLHSPSSPHPLPSLRLLRHRPGRDVWALLQGLRAQRLGARPRAPLRAAHGRRTLAGACLRKRGRPV